MVEETTETLATVNAANILSLSHIVDEFVPEALMVPLSVVVREELGQLHRVQVFADLVGDIDPNAGNWLFDRDQPRTVPAGS